MPRMRQMWAVGGRAGEPLEVHSYLRVPLDQDSGARLVTRAELLDQIGVLAEAGVTHVTMTFDELGTPAGGPPLDAVADAARWFAADVLPMARRSVDAPPRAGRRA
jgi:hypothetical protein